jgi:hypothetical protein
MNKPSPPTAPAGAPASSGPQPKRRQLVVGAGVAAGAAVAAAALKGRADPPAALAQATAQPVAAEGYRLTDHVRRYYETTRT